MSEELIARRRIKPSDLNSANRLFGGQMLSWIDETAAVYAQYQLKSAEVVTARMSEVNFVAPALQGDFLEFFASTVKMGRTSLTVHVRVVAKWFVDGVEHDKLIGECDMVFVHVDKNGKPTAHGLFG